MLEDLGRFRPESRCSVGRAGGDDHRLDREIGAASGAPSAEDVGPHERACSDGAAVVAAEAHRRNLDRRLLISAGVSTDPARCAKRVIS